MAPLTGAKPARERSYVLQQIMAVWSVLDVRKRVIVILSTLAVFAAVLGVSRMASTPSMSLLFGGLEAEAAGDVVNALEARGAAYDVRGGSIFVESARRDELRMTLASEGLPANSGKGYELLDSLSGFGTTSQMFDAAYWRAKEGELARTIVSSPLIRNARVHIATPPPQGFRQRVAPTASVTITANSGSLSAAHAKALKYLVSSAVPGLLPDGVSVIDARGGLILSGDEMASGGVDSADISERLKQNAVRLLEARVGYGNAVVEVSVDTQTDRESILERSFDPNGRVAISTETQETSQASSDAQNAGVSVASNLPNANAPGGGGNSSSNNSETRERVNYEVSETTREVLRSPGAIRKISVAVLVDGLRVPDANGQVIWSERPPEEMAALRELVASAVGFDEARGDTLTLKSMEFEPIVAEGSAPASGFFQGLNLDVMSIIQLAVLAIVSLVLGLFVVRPILSGESTPAQPAQLAPPPAGALPGALAPTGGVDLPDFPPMIGEIEEGEISLPNMAVVSDPGFGDDDNGLPPLGANSNDPVHRLRTLIEERQGETVEILRGWMEDEEETA